MAPGRAELSTDATVSPGPIEIRLTAVAQYVKVVILLGQLSIKVIAKLTGLAASPA